MKLCFLLFLTVAGAMCGACSETTSADSITETAATPKSSPSLVRARAKIDDSQTVRAQIKESVLNVRENFQKVYFTDANNGWLVGNVGDRSDSFTSNLYRTADGGKSWTKVPIKIEKNAEFSNIVFVNPAIGWLTIQRYGDVNKNTEKGWLMKTSDGGKTWQNLLARDHLNTDLLCFVDERNGYLTGSTSDPENVYSREQFLKKTTDGGLTWTDVGRALFEKNGFEDARGAITGLVAETPEILKAVMRSGKLYHSTDSGKNWRQFGPEFDFPPQTLPDNFGKLGNTDRLRMARGTWSIEGIYSYIATEKNNTWTVRWTDQDVCFFDLLFLSENEMFAVGRLGTNTYQKDGELEAVILYSSNAGENWQIIYRKKTDNESRADINSIAQIAENEFLAVGDEGLTINVKLTK